MAQYPERYGNQIIRLSRYMYLKSGYYKRLVDYFVNMAVINWTVDFEPKTIKYIDPAYIEDILSEIMILEDIDQ